MHHKVKWSLKKNKGKMITPKIKTLFLLTMAVRVTATTACRTVFIIVIEKEKKNFSFKAI